MVKASTVLIGAAAGGLAAAQTANRRRTASVSGVPSRTTAAVPTITTQANLKRQVALPTDFNPYTYIPSNLPFSINGTKIASEIASFATGTDTAYTAAACPTNRAFGGKCALWECSKTPQVFTIGAIETSVPLPDCGIRIGSAPTGTQANPTGAAQPTANAAPGRGLPLYGLNYLDSDVPELRARDEAAAGAHRRVYKWSLNDDYYQNQIDLI